MCVQYNTRTNCKFLQQYEQRNPHCGQNSTTKNQTKVTGFSQLISTNKPYVKASNVDDPTPNIIRWALLKAFKHLILTINTFHAIQTYGPPQSLLADFQIVITIEKSIVKMSIFCMAVCNQTQCRSQIHSITQVKARNIWKLLMNSECING
ncbi:Hypothetical_protein [Hexamita inflata]|uniref:Hypothetical_protein n=1 Tax=Hexamita inflata TaxID=28002 RepID=A0AA86RFW8_9EUKA|nr:Hypothetical protein HINF_LOCUS63372 [Hexamita inflata]CAI9975728.1 Hypothetical protein HINF_LOCUS63373 [Hexamita inflata]CAI9975729.1 Hypothetical protein HINF_LOCUS63374 [Hexamita inflata]CAI9975730.1 Hypothetical protein HINF_LOCUS63375 [Hexamita inflata]CAI9975732.1 Hypothetical protein HINF_LOCUS63377 [Hexamita inflata]